MSGVPWFAVLAAAIRAVPDPLDPLAFLTARFTSLAIAAGVHVLSAGARRQASSTCV